MENIAFTLRRLEMAAPVLKMADEKDPKAFVQLAALAMADDETLKMAAAGNDAALKLLQEKAYDMPSDEVADVLAFFTRASQKFSLVVGGLSPEEVQQVMAIKDLKLRTSLGLVLPAESPATPEASTQP